MPAKKPRTESPATLIDAVRYFADEDVALNFTKALRWADGVAVCPRCASKDSSFLKTRRLWKCRACAKQYSVKVGTIFEDSPIPLSKWLPAMWMLANCKNGISSYELARALDVTQKTAWFMLHRLRRAMQDESFDKFGGNVEVDETFIGAKARNMHLSKKRRLGVTPGNSMAGKVAVMGLLERHPDRGQSKIRLQTLPGRGKKDLQPLVREHVEAGASVNTDALLSYKGLTRDYVHNVIDHAEKYVEGNVHTNGLENFWSLLKRSLMGTYVSVEPFHLFRYLDEQAYRFNNRAETDLARFVGVLRDIVGKRLTYKALTADVAGI